MYDPGGRSKPRWLKNSQIAAQFSPCEQYRYSLEEIWDRNQPFVMFLMMNPSVANLDHADPTLIRTGNFARAWGMGGQLVGNVCAYRATNRLRLLDVPDPSGPENDGYLCEMARIAKFIVLAYGQLPNGILRRKAESTVRMLRHWPLTYLCLCRDGTPCHPLYLPKTLLPQPY